MRRFGLLLAAVTLVGSAALAQEGFGPIQPDMPTGKTPEQIVTAMGAREAEFAKARDNYVFKQDVKFQTINDDTNRPDGEYHEISDIGFSSDGRRTENVLFAPQNTLERVILTREDLDDVVHRLPFILTSEQLPEYNVSYLGRQRVDELDTYVFNVEPKTIEKNKRYFQGRVWVDQQDLQIVLASGKNVPDDVRRGHENLSPPFSTYYEQIDGKYWFPTYTKAEGTLHFSGGGGSMAQDVHVKSIVKYTDYKRYRSSARILTGVEEVPQQAPPKK
ncbi:hypothetical protein [Terriglobus sp.]|uniref:hypothetical protein n=1 Tax=Terriglobus sp. TaxID=1889013 RepID=UPI003B001A1A